VKSCALEVYLGARGFTVEVLEQRLNVLTLGNLGDASAARDHPFLTPRYWSAASCDRRDFRDVDGR
jgi:hypothetical protein